jgi:hypothetical protein
MSSFIQKLINNIIYDITGKDRSSDFPDEASKQEYRLQVAALMGACAIGLLFVFPPAAIVPAIVLIVKVKNYLTSDGDPPKNKPKFSKRGGIVIVVHKPY